MTDSRPRIYVMPVTSQCAESCQLCDHIGCRSAKTLTRQDVERSMLKAESGGFRRILLNSSALIWAEREWFLSAAKARGFSVGLRVVPAARKEVAAQFSELCRQFDFLEWFFDAREAFPESGREVFGPSDLLTVMVFQGAELKEWLAPIPADLRARLQFYCPLARPEAPEVLRVAEVHRQIAAAESAFPGLRIRPPQGYEIFEPRASADFEFEPLPQVVQCFGLRHELAPKVSVIIPTFNNCAYLLATLDHLVRQSLPRDQFEIIVVDDGSTDDTQAALSNWAKALPPEQLPRVQVLFFARPRPRQMGDNQYRAGIARNLGFKVSRGQIIAFLDSDIVTPPTYLAGLIDLHENHDVVQAIRLDLKKDVSHRQTRYEDIDPYRDAEVPEGDYWVNFFACTDWMSLPYFWKYACTYGFSLSRDLYEAVGRLRRTFIFYGFEDTDLGYRLAQMGCRFALNKAITYHLFHRPDRSEFKRSAGLRQRVLGETARIFYLNQLRPEIFTHFRSYMYEPWSRRRPSSSSRGPRSIQASSSIGEARWS